MPSFACFAQRQVALRQGSHKSRKYIQIHNALGLSKERLRKRIKDDVWETRRHIQANKGTCRAAEGCLTERFQGEQARSCPGSVSGLLRARQAYAHMRFLYKPRAVPVPWLLRARREHNLPDLQCRLFSPGDTLPRPPPKAVLRERAALRSQLWRTRNKVERASSCVRAVQMLTRWRRCGSLTSPGATGRARA